MRQDGTYETDGFNIVPLIECFLASKFDQPLRRPDGVVVIFEQLLDVLVAKNLNLAGYIASSSYLKCGPV
ncbi:MAG: hypothetical protein LCI00_08080 [Chloroflexi bacterium]|nr:hypothetical protein [Chloroflexota bacterium]